MPPPRAVVGAGESGARRLSDDQHRRGYGPLFELPPDDPPGAARSVHGGTTNSSGGVAPESGGGAGRQT